MAMRTQLGAVRPVEVAAYLQAKGWTRRSSFNESKASLWLAPAGRGDVDVLLPVRETVADYDLRIGELLRGIAQVEGRSPGEVMRDVATANADLIRVRVLGDAPAGDTLPFMEGLSLLKRIRDVFVAAARAAIEKRAFFSNRPSETILEFMEQLRLGQTEHGSFVFTLVSPLPVQVPAGPQTNGAEPESFERRVTVTLMQALRAMEQAAKIAAAEGGSIDAFRRAIESGVSANLCDAVVGLKGVCPNSTIEFSVSWATLRHASKNVPDTVTLLPESSPFIEAASDAFWGMPKDYDVKLEGAVVDVANENASSGDAVLMAYVDGHARRVHTHFEAPVYEEVVRAYKDRLIVKCEGDLVKEAGVLRLKNPRYFELGRGGQGLN